MPVIRRTRSFSVENVGFNYRETDARNPLNPAISWYLSADRQDATAFTVRLSPPLNWTIPPKTSVALCKSATPIMEKKIVDALLQARDRNLYRSITDCGAGGFSSAVGEMGEPVGAEGYIYERVSLKYEGLAPWEIWLSEAQERMVIAVPPENLSEKLMEICEAEFVEATVLGTFTDTHRLQVFYEGEIVGDLEMEFLHHGLPKPVKQAVWQPPKHQEMVSRDETTKNYTDDLKQLLASPNIASKESVIRQYDHEVQGRYGHQSARRCSKRRTERCPASLHPF